MKGINTLKHSEGYKTVVLRIYFTQKLLIKRLIEGEKSIIVETVDLVRKEPPC